MTAAKADKAVRIKALWDHWRENIRQRRGATREVREQLLAERDTIRVQLTTLKELLPPQGHSPLTERQRLAIAEGQRRRRKREQREQAEATVR